LNGTLEQKKKVEDNAQKASFIFYKIANEWDCFNHRQKQEILRLLFGRLVLTDDRLEVGNRTPFELLQNL
jgi:hypothetical protein